MALPAEFIDRLKAANPIAEVMGSYVNLKRTGRDYICLCPFHNEKTPSCHVHPDKEFFHCFGCGADGDAINFAERMFGLSPLDAARKLIADFHLNIDTYTASPPKSAKTNKQNKEQELLRAFQLYRRDALFCLCKYHCLLHNGIKELAPTTPEELEHCHPLYEEAIHNIDFINWITEELENANIQQQIELLDIYKEVITHARKRSTETKHPS